MTRPTPRSTSRREFLQNTGRIAATAALTSMVVPVHAAQDSTVGVGDVKQDWLHTGVVEPTHLEPGEEHHPLDALEQIHHHRIGYRQGSVV